MGLIGASLKSCLAYLMFSSYVSYEFAKEQDYRSVYAFLVFADILLNGAFDVTSIFISFVKLAVYVYISEYAHQTLSENVLYRLLIGTEGNKSLFIPLTIFVFIDMWL
jgi:hypothetical protein